MIRTLLTTTAIALALGTAAYAQDAAPAAPATTETAPAAGDTTTAPAAGDTTTAPATGDTTAAPAGDAMAPAGDAMSTETPPAGGATSTEMAPAGDAMTPAARTPLDMASGYTAGEGDAIASEVMGAPIYSSAADDAEEIGTVNDLVISADGDILAVVIGVGGFLGIGEKNVAVDFTELSYEMAADDTMRWVLPTTAEALTAAPDFVWEDPADAANSDAMAPAGDAMAPATDPAMAPAGDAMAPAAGDAGAVSETPATN